MATILAFDTAMGECGVALWREGAILASRFEAERNQQTRLLVPMIDAVMKEAGVDFTALDAIATTSGPGSFTGIRIGLAVARGLQLATGIPALAVSTLELLAWQRYRLGEQEVFELSALTAKGAAQSGGGLGGQAPQPNIIVSAINAYRGEVYVQAFSPLPLGEGVRLKPHSPAQAIPADALFDFLPKEPHAVAGDVAALMAPPATHRPDVAALAEYAGRNHPLPLADYPAQPLYIRAPDAKPQTQTGA